jgi:hypothetical protein
LEELIVSLLHGVDGIPLVVRQPAILEYRRLLRIDIGQFSVR